MNNGFPNNSFFLYLDFDIMSTKRNLSYPEIELNLHEAISLKASL